MNPIIRVIGKNLFIIASIYLLAGNAYSASEFLLENGANKKYTDFSNCLKSSNNFFTLCIDELKAYISAENKYIKVKKTDESKNRLRKVVKYIKKSTDIYIQKAEKTNDVRDYDQATIAATLLTKLSPKYKIEYTSFLDKSTAKKQGSTVSLGLSNYFKTIKQKEPELKVIRKLIKNALPVYDSLDASLRSSLDRFFNSFIDRYYDHLAVINNAIESKNFPVVTKLKYRHQAYIDVTEIHQINSRSEDITQIKQQIADTLNQHFKTLKGQTEDLNGRFVSGDALDAIEVNTQIQYINYFLDMGRIISQNRLVGFSKVRKFPQSDIDNLESHRSFYSQSVVVQQLASSQSYSGALNQGYASMADAYQDRLTNEVVRRVNHNANSAYNYFQEVFVGNRLEALSLLLNLPTKYFSDVSKDKRISALDQFVALILKDIDNHVDKGNYSTAFETLAKLEYMPAYFDRYQKIHQEKQLAVLDSYADTLFYKVAALVDNDDYDAVFKHLKFAESISGYLKRFKDKHEEVIENTRRLADSYWLDRIIQMVESGSLPRAITVIKTKIHASDKKQSAAAKIVDTTRSEFSALSQKLGYQELLSELKSLQESGYVPDNKLKTLNEVMTRTYQGWVVDEIEVGEFVSAARHIFESGNGLSVEIRSELNDDLLDAVNVGSKKNPDAMLSVLQTMNDITAIPTETKVSIDNLEQEIVNRWSMNVAENGILNCKDWTALKIGLEARVSLNFMNAPPIGGPKEKGKYYQWPCEIADVYSSTNLACRWKMAFFLVDGIEQSFPDEIQQNGTYWVIGKYNRNEKTTLNQLVPVLDDAYIAACN